MKQFITLSLIGLICLPFAHAQQRLEGKSKTYHYQMGKDQQASQRTIRVKSPKFFGEDGLVIIIPGAEEKEQKPQAEAREYQRGNYSYSYSINGKEKKYNYNNTPSHRTIPFLQIDQSSFRFHDSNDNNHLDAEESAELVFDLYNDGEGLAKDMVLRIETDGSSRGIEYKSRYMIGDLHSGDQKRVHVPIKGGYSLQTGKANIKIKIEERNGFGADPMIVELPTHEAFRPDIKINDYIVKTSSDEIMSKVPFDLQLVVQNLGKGAAKNLKIDLVLPEHIICLSESKYVTLNEMNPGESQVIQFTLVANDRYQRNDIPVKIRVDERLERGRDAQAPRFRMESNINLKMGSRSPSIIKLKSAYAPVELDKVEVAYLASDVDRNVPNLGPSYKRRYALIIGNEDYTTYQSNLANEANVEFAESDARTFAQYAEKVLGIPQENITLKTNVISTQFNRELKRFIDKAQYTDGDVELFFFYSGHGYPDKESGEAFLMPVDISAENVQEGLALSRLYKELTKYPARRVTVFLDACFSGGGRDQGLLAARGVRIKPKRNVIEDGNMVVFSASTDLQESLAWKDKRHGMFSYFLFKKMKESKGDLTYEELASYLEQMVSLTSSDVNYRSQNPSVNVSLDALDNWKSWRIR